ncbi:MAG: TonB-dependent receptor [Opitutia bacterium]
MHEQTPDAGAATERKALAINLDRSAYGAFAEIGAGQEVVRHFFKAGGASGTVAKSMSAYDMRVSDAIYGHPKRYVSRERLEQMLQHEYQLLVDRLAAERGGQTRFFAFADTVATTPHDGKGQGHSWIGLRFQEAPLAAPSEVLLHLRLWDKDAGRQQDALGIVGVNLIHAALNARPGVDAFLTALVEGVGVGRVEVEFVHFKGPAFGAFDNRSAALRLVRLGLTDAVLFGPEGVPEVPSEYLYKKSLLVARGTFRPVSLVNEDMLACALRNLGASAADVLPLFEMCIGSDPHPEAELIDRIRLVATLRRPLLVTRHRGWYRLPAYFRMHTTGRITLVAGMNNLVDLFNPEHYTQLEGGVLESFGRLFKDGVQVMVYPMRGDQLRRLVADPVACKVCFPESYAIREDAVIAAGDIQMRPTVAGLFQHLLNNGFFVPIAGADPAAMACQPRTLAARIRAGEAGWEKEVPPPVAIAIRSLKLWAD